MGGGSGAEHPGGTVRNGGCIGTSIACGCGDNHTSIKGFKESQFHCITVGIFTTRDGVIDDIHAIQDCLLDSCDGVLTRALTAGGGRVADIIGDNLCVRRNAGDGHRGSVEIQVHCIPSNRAGSVRTVTIAVFGGHKVGGSVVGVAVCTHQLVIASIRILRVPAGSANTQVITGPFIGKSICRCVTE